MEIKATAFEKGEAIPVKYTCDGDNVSPEIEIDDPDNNGYYILVIDDPDAPGALFTHWIIYNIPATVKKIKENIDKNEVTEDGFYQGINDFNKIGYGGPCPPPGYNHRYYFILYKTDKIIEKKQLTSNEIFPIVEPLKNKTEFYAIYGRQKK